MSKSEAQVAFIAAAVAVAAFVLACDSVSLTGPNSGTAQNCQVTFDDKLPRYGGAYFRVESPTNCPFKLDVWPKLLTYAAKASFPPGSTLRQYQVTWSDRLGRPFSVFVDSPWSVENGNDIVVISGDYYAGQGGFDSFNNGFDKTDNQILTGQGWSHGIGTLTYKFGTPGVNLKAPARVGNGVPYNVAATTDDPVWVTPVTWAWKVDGVPIANNSGPLLQWEGNGTYQAIQATGTDYHGNTHTRLIQVAACPGTQLNC